MDSRLNFSGGMEALIPIGDAVDSHQAVGLWWANQVLHPVIDSGLGTAAPRYLELPDTVRAMLEPRIGGFALALSHLSRITGRNNIHVDYMADRILTDAAALAHMPSDPRVFSPKSFTQITNGRVTARAGQSAAETQIWPPIVD